MVTLLYNIGIFILKMHHHNITSGICCFPVIFVDCHLIHKTQDDKSMTDNTGSITPSSDHLVEGQATVIFHREEIIYINI